MKKVQFLAAAFVAVALTACNAPAEGGEEVNETVNTEVADEPSEEVADSLATEAADSTAVEAEEMTEESHEGHEH